MIATLNGTDTIKTMSNGQHRAHRMGGYWIGDYPTYANAERALQIANSQGATADQRGVYDGGCNAAEADHMTAIISAGYDMLFGEQPQPVDMDTVRRCILAGEPIKLVGGMPVKP